MLDTSARLLRLLALLPTRPDWTGPELAARLEVTGRTVRRDMARLRELGYPVQATPGVAGGYRLAAGSTLPPLLLDDDEAVAVVLSLRTATHQGVTGGAETAVRALAKLERVLPARLRRRAAALRLATVPLTGPAPTADPDVLTVIAEACRDQHRLTFGYRDRDGAASVRTTEPHRLVHTGRRWYLVARDHDRDDWRTFRADRIDDPRPTGIRFTPRNPPDAAAFVADAVTTGPYRLRARVRVHAPAHVVAERFPPGTGVVEAVDRHSCLLVTGADRLAPIAVHLAALGHDFTVLEPAELVDELGTLAARLAAAHRASAAGICRTPVSS
ncbi:helix-turn-helix transcriptional regulator [Jidongwangia harbinensis]|uniref:helix-turn-helix transcriptional regulator n=1 Tax=Jidongwangia harbinensis TaxID=2878561 RepID=UPI001CD926CD|nr:YafY family protein [Jidongwangia harbinensis]MCA2217589.1 YafY family transcriptional regulator [Jidongwangia harbinensis]